MSEVPVVAVIVAKPGSEQVVRAAMEALVEPTRAEAGCRSYTLYESAAAAGTFVTVEAWEDMSDLDTHMATAHIAATVAAIQDHIAVPPAIHPLTALDG